MPTRSSREKPVSASHVVVREHDPAVGVGDDQALRGGLQQGARLDQASQPSERGVVGARDLFDLR